MALGDVEKHHLYRDQAVAGKYRAACDRRIYVVQYPGTMEEQVRPSAEFITCKRCQVTYLYHDAVKAWANSDINPRNSETQKEKVVTLPADTEPEPDIIEYGRHKFEVGTFPNTHVPAIYCQQPECASTNWGGTNRKHLADSNCPGYVGGLARLDERSGILPTLPDGYPQLFVTPEGEIDYTDEDYSGDEPHESVTAPLRNLHDDGPEHPYFRHDCDRCTYLGSVEETDLYFCGAVKSLPTVVARTGDDPAEYESGLSFIEEVPLLALAYVRAQKLGLL